MIPMRGFFAGFAVGFASGVVFRVMAERDFEPAKDVFKTSIGIAHKVGDAISETYGRLIENIEDLRSQILSERSPPRATDRSAEQAGASNRAAAGKAAASRARGVSRRDSRKRASQRARLRTRSHEMNA